MVLGEKVLFRLPHHERPGRHQHHERAVLRMFERFAAHHRNHVREMSRRKTRGSIFRITESRLRDQWAARDGLRYLRKGRGENPNELFFMASSTIGSGRLARRGTRPKEQASRR